MTLYALVDCNNFYVSCERVFDPKLRGRPVVVLSNNDGCAVSRSQEAKDLGIKMAQPWFEFRHFEQSHGLVVLSSNYALYGAMSERVMTILRDMAPKQEVYSIDECFLDFSGVAGPEAHGHEMRNRLLQLTHIPVGVGFGSTKTRAKLANGIAKSLKRLGGVFNLERLTPGQENNVFGKLPVDEVWGVGGQLKKKLANFGIVTVRELRDANEEEIRTRFGVVLARTVLELRGVSCLGFEELAPRKQQIMCSRSFGTLVTDLGSLKEAVLLHATRASEKLRSEGSATQAVSVFIHSNPFREQDEQYRASRFVPLSTPTQDTRRIVMAATAGLESMFRPGINYKKAGVFLTELSDAGTSQRDLFSQGDSERSKRLMGVVDAVNMKYGRGATFFAGSGVERVWAMRTEKKSPNYLSRWEELPVAGA